MTQAHFVSQILGMFIKFGRNINLLTLKFLCGKNQHIIATLANFCYKANEQGFIKLVTNVFNFFCK